MKTLIIEDEKAALRNLKAVMQEVDTDFEIVGEVDSIFDGVEWFRTHPMPELVFMDIHLADGSAFDICAQVDITCPIIFTTAYDEYALRAFKVNSVAYLLKPISRTDLQEAMHKLELLGGQPKVEKQPDLSEILRSLKKEESYKTHFLVPVKGDKFLPVSVESIQYFYISNGLVKASTERGRSLCSRSRSTSWPNCSTRTIFSGPTASSSCRGRPYPTSACGSTDGWPST